ncbi:NHLP leader peptide family natural product precursor [Thiocystis minor]|uniref:NHLP leader peptide family RiPP precursor n=1 Tax=Thiocystis minor TaxID=61597 RepID=UPI0019119AF9|nr:NHLP leader peptide family RiPP precursor [Thiocystis minor]MBK5966210.1 NHLP leader peptide family natural product precursor [Thiocystis minor]
MNDQAKQYQQLIAKCWADDAFKQRLLDDPAGTLTAEGIEVPAGVSVKVAENTEQVFHLVIPARPTDLSDDAVGIVYGGRCGQFGTEKCG